MIKDKELLSELENLRSVAPDARWRQECRHILLSQISGQSDDASQGIWQRFFNCQFFEWASQPSTIILSILLLLIGGGASGMVVAQHAKPGDSLYIAKIISEKTRESVTFDEKGKVKLNMEFASNRAKEIEQILGESCQGATADVQKVAELENNFKKEIANAKNRIEKIEKSEQAKNLQATKIADKPKTAPVNVPATQNTPQTIYGANLGKSNQGMQTTDGQTAQTQQTGQENCVSSTQSTTTKAILDEAEKLFAGKDYKGAVDKLQQASDVINKSTDNSTGSEQASSTK